MKQAINKFKDILGYFPTTISKLYGGLNSNNFLIDNRYVLRIKLINIDRYYQPNQEALIEKACQKLKIGASLIYLDISDGTKITEFIPKTHYMHTPPNHEEIKLAANIINQFHKLPDEAINSFDKHGRLAFYRSLSNHRSNLNDEQSLINKIDEIDKRYSCVVCHNDLVRGNFLYDDKRVYLIDYEYAGKNNYLFDLASFITENDIVEPKLINQFLSSYNHKHPIDKDDFMTYCHFLDLLWFYWAMAMYKITNKKIYYQIAQTKNKRLLNIIY
jgi:thiamine kinase-like enzyme